MPARGLMWFTILSFALFPWIVGGIYLFDGSDSANFAQDAHAWATSVYVATSEDFGWLLPMLLAVTLAFGFSNSQLKEKWSKEQRVSAASRRVIPLAIGIICLEIAILGAVPFEFKYAAGTSTFAVVLASIFIVITSIEMAHLLPTRPLVEQRDALAADLRAQARLIGFWRDTPPPVAWRWAIVVLNVIGIAVVSWGAGVLVAAICQPTNAIAELQVSAVLSTLSAGAAAFATKSRMRRTSPGHPKSVPRVLLDSCANYFLVIAFAALTVFCVVVAGSMGITSLMVTCSAAFVAGTLVGLWSGTRVAPSRKSRFLLGGLVRGKTYQDIRNEWVRTRSRRETIVRELESRGSASATP